MLPMLTPPPESIKARDLAPAIRESASVSRPYRESAETETSRELV